MKIMNCRELGGPCNEKQSAPTPPVIGSTMPVMWPEHAGAARST